MSKTFNIAVCGLGWWGSKIVRNCHRHPSISYLAACDPNPAVREGILSEYSIPVFGDLKTALQSHPLDCVFVITPPETHYELVKYALSNGLHTVVAKPPTLTFRETQDLIKIAKTNKLTLMTDATFCYSPPISKIQEILKSGQLGSIKHVESIRYGDNLRVQGYQRLRDAMHTTGTNVIQDLVMHDLAIITHLFAEDFSVKAVDQSDTLFNGLSDTAHIHLKSADKTIHIALSWIMPERTRKLTICGEKAILVWDDLSPDKRLWSLDTKGENEEIYNLGNEEPLYSMLNHFMQSIVTGVEPATGYSLMDKTMRLFESLKD